MTQSAKTVSIRHLHAAVKTALEAAMKAHPDFATAASPSLDTSVPLPIIIRIPWICGLPVPWPLADLQKVAAFTDTLVASLASDQQIAALAAEGKFERTVYVSGSTVDIGFKPADARFTQ